MARARTTDSDQKRSAVALIKSVAILQLKLLLDTVRDLALAPTAIAAALLDLLLIKHQDPRFFRSVLRIGEYSDRWIDVWSGGRHPDEPQRENVDALIARVEEVVRDPEIGARRARVLRRWAERQMARAPQRTAATPPQPPEPPKAVARDRTSS